MRGGERGGRAERRTRDGERALLRSPTSSSLARATDTSSGPVRLLLGVLRCGASRLARDAKLSLREGDTSSGSGAEEGGGGAKSDLRKAVDESLGEHDTRWLERAKAKAQIWAGRGESVSARAEGRWGGGGGGGAHPGHLVCDSADELVAGGAALRVIERGWTDAQDDVWVSRGDCDDERDEEAVVKMGGVRVGLGV